MGPSRYRAPCPAGGGGGPPIPARRVRASRAARHFRSTPLHACRLPPPHLPSWLRLWEATDTHGYQRLTDEDGGAAAHAAAAAAATEAGEAAAAAGAAGSAGAPEAHAGLLSRALFSWVGGLVRLGHRKTLEAEDLWATLLQVGWLAWLGWARLAGWAGQRDSVARPVTGLGWAGLGWAGLGCPRQ